MRYWNRTVYHWHTVVIDLDGDVDVYTHRTESRRRDFVDGLEIALAYVDDELAPDDRERCTAAVVAKGITLDSARSNSPESFDP